MCVLLCDALLAHTTQSCGAHEHALVMWQAVVDHLIVMRVLTCCGQSLSRSVLCVVFCVGFLMTLGVGLRTTSGAATRARNTGRRVRSGASTRSVRVRTKTHFYKPKTLKLKRNPKVQRKSVPSTPRLDKFSIIRFPLTTGNFHACGSLPGCTCSECVCSPAIPH